MDSTRLHILEELEHWSDWSEKIELRISPDVSFMPGGHNGPYFDLETPLRNTAHWLSLHSILFGITQEEKYRDRATRLKNFLLDQRIYRRKYGDVHRQKEGKDSCNGIIGPTWLAEGLSKAGLYLKDESSMAAAKQMISEFPFSEKDYAWHKIEPDTGAGKVDFTYNHESWFASIKAEIFGATKDVGAFLDRSENFSFRVHSSGRISHLLYSNSAQGLVAQASFRVNQMRRKEFFENREIGYQLFVLFSLARLKKIFPNHSLFKSLAFERTLSFVDESSFFSKLKDNKYAYDYNSPAYEFPLIGLCWRSHFKRIDVDQKIIELLQFLREQRSPWAKKEVIYALPDPLTLFSRVYELAIALEPNN